MSGRYVASIDQGTASSRCFVFDNRARIVSVAQQEHRQHFPRPGWVEHDPEEIWQNVMSVVRVALEKADVSPRDLCSLGIANQRETTVLWDRRTGAPVHNAITWQDMRTDRLCREIGRDFGEERMREKTGLPISTQVERVGAKTLRACADPGRGSRARRRHRVLGSQAYGSRVEREPPHRRGTAPSTAGRA